MRGLQLTVLISTAVVLFGVAGWAVWHTWQEQELPSEEGVPASYINLGPDGRAFYKSYTFDFSSVDATRPDSAGLVLEGALRESLGGDPSLRRPDGTWRVPMVIVTERKAVWEHVERIRQACRSVGITDVTVKSRPETFPGGKVVGAQGESPEALFINLRVGGWVYLRSYEFWLERRSEDERRDELLALDDALRIRMDNDPDLGADLRSGRKPLIIQADAEARPEHIQAIRRIGEARGIRKIDVRTRTP